MMQSTRFYIYLAILIIAAFVGAKRFSIMDGAMKVLAVLLIVTAISESSTEIVLRLHLGKEVVYRIFTPVQGCLTTLFFYYGLYKQKKLATTAAIVFGWIIIGLCNYFVVEKMNLPYLNIIMIECFAVIAMSLHALYTILLNDELQDVKAQPIFWAWVIILFFWCSTFFFWSSYKMLYRTKSPYLETFMFYHGIINMVTYGSFGFIFLYYRKFIKWQQATRSPS